MPRRRGLDFGVVSNCFWASSVADAKVWLAPFKALGISDLSLSSYAYFVEDANEEHLRNAVEAARELELPMAVLEVGAPAQLDVPGLCLGEDVCEIMCKGRAAVELAPGRAARPPQSLVTCPFEDFADPGRAHVGCDGQLQICQGISAGNVFLGRDGELEEGARSCRSRAAWPRCSTVRPSVPARHPRDHGRRALGPGPGLRAHARARAVRRRVPPLLRGAVGAAPALPRRPDPGAVLRRRRER